MSKSSNSNQIENYAPNDLIKLSKLPAKKKFSVQKIVEIFLIYDKKFSVHK